MDYGSVGEYNMEECRGGAPRRPSSAIPWKVDAAPPAGSFENPLYATISNAAPANRLVDGAKRLSTRHPSQNPLFDAQASGQRPRSSGSVIRFASEHDGERRSASITAYRPGKYDMCHSFGSSGQRMNLFSMP